MVQFIPLLIIIALPIIVILLKILVNVFIQHTSTILIILRIEMVPALIKQTIPIQQYPPSQPAKNASPGADLCQNCENHHTINKQSFPAKTHLGITSQSSSSFPSSIHTTKLSPPTTAISKRQHHQRKYHKRNKTNNVAPANTPLSRHHVKTYDHVEAQPPTLLAPKVGCIRTKNPMFLFVFCLSNRKIFSIRIPTDLRPPAGSCLLRF